MSNAMRASKCRKADSSVFAKLDERAHIDD